MKNLIDSLKSRFAYFSYETGTMFLRSSGVDPSDLPHFRDDDYVKWYRGLRSKRKGEKVEIRGNYFSQNNMAYKQNGQWHPGKIEKVPIRETVPLDIAARAEALQRKKSTEFTGFPYQPDPEYGFMPKE